MVENETTEEAASDSVTLFGGKNAIDIKEVIRQEPNSFNDPHN